MKIIPYSWHSKEQLRQLETSIKLELHAIMNEHGSDSEEFWSKHDELVALQAALYGQHEKPIAHA